MCRKYCFQRVFSQTRYNHDCELSDSRFSATKLANHSYYMDFHVNYMNKGKIIAHQPKALCAQKKQEAFCHCCNLVRKLYHNCYS